jgi:hypothetical protein
MKFNAIISNSPVLQKSRTSETSASLRKPAEAFNYYRRSETKTDVNGSG